MEENARPPEECWNCGQPVEVPETGWVRHCARCDVKWVRVGRVGLT